MCYNGFTIKLDLFKYKRFKNGSVAKELLYRTTLHHNSAYLISIFVMPRDLFCSIDGSVNISETWLQGGNSLNESFVVVRKKDITR